MSDLIITELKGSETASRLAQSFYEIHNNSAVGKVYITVFENDQKSLICPQASLFQKLAKMDHSWHS